MSTNREEPRPGLADQMIAAVQRALNQPADTLPTADGLTPVSAAVEVYAGLIPGQAMEEYTHRWVLTSADRHSEEGQLRLIEMNGQAMAYALALMEPKQLNWVKLEWIWF